jgi:predicted AAA+ superfamily ATPase
MVERPQLLARLRAGLRTSPAVALLGPRQCGKTTLARQLAGTSKSTYFDLESPVDLARLSEPMTALESLRGLIVIDEVQRHPDLFPILRVLLDRKPVRARFLILGNASPELLRQSSETLAGRIAIVEMSGFTLEELNRPDLNRLWVRGGFPRRGRRIMGGVRHRTTSRSCAQGQSLLLAHAGRRRTGSAVVSERSAYWN